MTTLPVKALYVVCFNTTYVCKFSSRTDRENPASKSKCDLKESKLSIQQDAAFAGGWGRGNDTCLIYVTPDSGGVVLAGDGGAVVSVCLYLP